MSDSLESFISAKFTALALSIPEDDVEYIARLVEEEELEDEDKKEGVKGMLEGFLTDGQTPEDLDPAVTTIIEHWRSREDTRRAEEDAKKAGEGGDDGESDSGSDSGSDIEGELSGKTLNPAERKAKKAKVKAQTTLLDSLTPEELAAAQRRALLAHYGYVDEDAAATAEDAVSAASGVEGDTLRKREEEKEARERRALIDAAIRGEAKRKKKSKRSRETVDLMAPNLNKEKVQVKAQMLRQIAKQESQSVQARDKAALEKQRADQAKAKADKQKKAQKQERRA